MFKLVRNERGQLAIFVALTFQVLFVFFAMVVNVGLLVHHKINLQNSVDLAAYYGAMKQAEMLGAIGHVNYQIRQSWKLVSWRARVLGSLGYIDRGRYPHPIHAKLSDQDMLWQGSNGPTPPVACFTYRPNWLDVPERESSCKQVLDGTSIPEIPVPRVIAGFLSFNSTIKRFSERMRDAAKARCEYLGPANWWMTAGMMSAYMQDVTNRKMTIYALASALSADESDFADVDSGMVRGGVQNTLMKNLTKPNRDGMQTFEFFNSLAAGDCGGGSNNEPPGWLRDIQVQPTLMYADFDCEGDIIPSIQFVGTAPKYYGQYKDNIDPEGVIIQSMQNYSSVPAEHPSAGVEKNPWCMAYVAVEASTRPQIPFSPINQPVELKAKAYAKPFGGRIGPWYNAVWPSGSDRSSGGPKIDPLLPPRVGVGGGGGGADPNDLSRIPNASRYIGDQFGMSSHMTIIEQGKRIHDAANQSQAKKFYYSYYEQNFLPFTDNQTGDILPWDGAGEEGNDQFLRNLELAAIAPNMFDLTYYSIDPDYHENYYRRLKAGIDRASNGEFLFRPDLGSRIGEDLESFSIRDQMNFVNTGVYFDKSKVPYYAEDIGHLLTSWSAIDLGDYSFDRTISSEYFGKCLGEPVDEPGQSIPGSCVAGGRTGYSVKLVSKDHLMQSDLPLGGEGTTGEIKNKPPF